jgi:uncharacterized OB-fold protein
MSSIRFDADSGRPLPIPNPTTQPYFDAARDHRLALQRCPRDGFFFYPRSRCPRCWGDDWEWEQTSGRGEVHAFTIDHIGHDPALAYLAPFAIAVIELEEGPRMTANVVGCPVEEVRLGMPVEVCFEDVDEHTLVQFRPRTDQVERRARLEELER